MELERIIKVEDRVIEPKPMIENKNNVEVVNEYVKETKLKMILRVYIDETTNRMYIDLAAAIKLGLLTLEQKDNFPSGFYPVSQEIINKIKSMGYEIEYIHFNKREYSLHLSPIDYDDNLNNFQKEENDIIESEVDSIEDTVNTKFRR